jgi:replicative DNA helicase
MMTDKSSMQQVLGCLMQRPQFLSEIDKYVLMTTDFSTRLEKYIFSAILSLYKNGANRIEPIDIANCLEIDIAAKKTFEAQNGIEYLHDIIEFSSIENFPYYYNKLKKINLLRDLKKQGFDTSDFYNDDLTDPRADEINSRFEQLSLKDICDEIRKRIIHLESDYVKNGEVEVLRAVDGIRDFIENLNETVTIGPPVQGHIYNQIIGGAERGALTIRSGSSGLGKTRQAVADACYLAYPIRYDSVTRQWVQTGSCEKVLFVITEQTIPQIRKMILAYLSDINDSRFKLGNFSADEQERLNNAASIMEQFAENLIIIKIPAPSIDVTKTMIREVSLTNNISCVFFDYIFINPELLKEFKGANLRNDELLLLFSTALKDLAVELNVAMFTSTQVNASADDNKNIRNEASLAGGRSTINKADNGAIMARPTNEELESLQEMTNKYGTPNLVTDIFKVRSGEWTQVRIWSQVNLGTMKKKDLFITDSRLEPIGNFFADESWEVQNWSDEEYQATMAYLKVLNERAIYGLSGNN